MTSAEISISYKSARVFVHQLRSKKSRQKLLGFNGRLTVNKSYAFFCMPSLIFTEMMLIGDKHNALSISITITSKYSLLSIIRTFKGNRKKFELSGVRVIEGTII